MSDKYITLDVTHSVRHHFRTANFITLNDKDSAKETNFQSFVRTPKYKMFQS